MNYREVARKLRSLGCEELAKKGKGSHRKWRNSRAKVMITPVLPNWGNQDLKPGTIRSTVRLLGIDWSDFEDA